MTHLNVLMLFPKVNNPGDTLLCACVLEDASTGREYSCGNEPCIFFQMICSSGDAHGTNKPKQQLPLHIVCKRAATTEYMKYADCYSFLLQYQDPAAVE